MKKLVAIFLALAIITTCVACAQDMTSGDFQKEFEKFDWENSAPNAVAMEADRLLDMLEDLPSETQKSLSDVREKLEDYKMADERKDEEDLPKDETLGDEEILEEDGMLGQDGMFGEDDILGDAVPDEMEKSDKSLMSAKIKADDKDTKNADDKIASPEKTDKPEKQTRPTRPAVKPNHPKRPMRPLPDSRR